MTEARAVGALVVAGDQACQRGDVAALGEIAERLARALPEPQHCALTHVAALCRTEPARAVDEWTRLHDELYPSDAREA